VAMPFSGDNAKSCLSIQSYFNSVFHVLGHTVLIFFLLSQSTSGLGCSSTDELVSANWHPYSQAQTPGILLAVVQVSQQSGLGPPDAYNREPGRILLLHSADLSSPANHG